MYLVRKTKTGKAHYWNGQDTACRMWSTGGMNHRRYTTVEDKQHQPICTMCKQVHRTRQYVMQGRTEIA